MYRKVDEMLLCSKFGFHLLILNIHVATYPYIHTYIHTYIHIYIHRCLFASTAGEVRNGGLTPCRCMGAFDSQFC